MTNSNDYIFNNTFPSNEHNRKPIVDSLLESVNRYIPRIDLKNEELYLVLDEAITNAMEHGNHWDVNLKIFVTAQTIGNNLVIKITDQGKGFNPVELQEKLKKRDPLSTRGRGVFIITQFCKPAWNSSGNEITLTFPLVS